MERKLLHYGIHPAVVASHVARTTHNGSERITPSLRINKTLRRAVRVAYSLAACLFVLYVTRA